MRYFDAETVADHLTYDACIPLMKEAMEKLSLGQTQQMLRQILPLGGGKMYGIMGGALGENASFGSKLVAVTPSTEGRTKSSHQGVVVLFDSETLAPAFLAEAGMVTAIRTASTSAMATDLLANEQAKTLCVLGTGEQALHHALAIPKVRPIEKILIWGRAQDKAQALAEKVCEQTSIPTTATALIQDAVLDADIICTVTAAKEPILESSWIKAGAHINVVGSSFDGPREIDDALVARSRFIADSRESVLAQGSEIRHAIASGVVGEDHVVAEIGEVALGNIPGRLGEDDVTIYKSLGHIVQDIAAASFLQNIE